LPLLEQIGFNFRAELKVIHRVDTKFPGPTASFDTGFSIPALR
jgi:hypothetical protein